MAFNFPSSPTNGQTVTTPNGVVFVWNGTAWAPLNVALPPYATLASPVFTGNPQTPTAAVGDADQSIASTAFVGTAVAPAFDNVGRNLVNNPLFNIQQRGLGPWTTNGSFTADRWNLTFNLDTNNVAISAASDTDRAQMGDEAVVSYLGRTFTGNAGAASYSLFIQNIENVRRLGGKTVTVSFYANASAALRFGVSINQYFGTGGSPSATVSGAGQAVTLSTTWARYSLTFNLPSLVGKVLGTNNDNATQLFLWYSSGTTQAPNSGIGVQSGTINIWGVQLEVGSVATPLEKLEYTDDLQHCKRFYQVGYVQQQIQSQGTPSSYITIFPLPVLMRAPPTMTPNFSTQTGGTGALAANGPGNYQFTISVTAATGNVVSIYGGFAASADL